MLGSLSTEEHASVQAHVERGCAYCQDQLREAALTVYFLSRMPRTERPDAKQKFALFQRLRKGKG